tara:strand:+ start:2304 stop:3395 length:1092 start_codon:yes stop_codon:yes gene_type:complete
MITKTEVFEALKDSTSRASEKSKNAYSMSLKNLFNMLELDDIKNADDELKNIKNVMKLLDESKKIKKISTLKNYLVAIRVWLLRDPEKNEELLKEYWEKLDKIITIHKNETNENKKTEKQSQNWIDWDILRNKVLKYYAREYKRLNLNKKETLTKKELELLRNFIVAYLYLDFDNIHNYDKKIFPRRNDYVDMKSISYNKFKELSNEEKLKYNWLITRSPRNRVLVFNKYKTFKKYGTIKIKITGPLNSILNVYLKHHKNEFLITQKNGNKFTTNNFSKYLIKVFEPSGKKITVNLLRHILLSKIYGGIPKNEILETIAQRMGHNVLRALDYRKVEKDKPHAPVVDSDILNDILNDDANPEIK